MDHLDDELLSRLVDDDVSPEERRLTEAHLTTCVACAARLAALRSTVMLLQGLPSPRTARSFQLGSVHARPASGWRRFTAWLPAGMPALRAAVVAVVLVVGGAAAFAAIQDDNLDGPSTGIVQPEPTVAGLGGDDAATLLPTVSDAMIEQTQAKTPLPTATTDASASRSGQAADAAEIATSTTAPTQEVAEEAPTVSAAPDIVPTSTARRLPTATPARDAIFGIDTDESSDVDEAGPAPPSATADEADEPSDEAAGDADVSESDDEGPAAEAPPESSAAFAPATSTVTASPSPTWHVEAASTPFASPVASPVSSPVVSPVASPSARFIPIDGDTTAQMSARRIDEMLALAIILMAGGIVVAVWATRGVPRYASEPFSDR